MGPSLAHSKNPLQQQNANVSYTHEDQLNMLNAQIGLSNESKNLSTAKYVNLEARRILGQGSFGKFNSFLFILTALFIGFVFEAVDKDSGQIVAVKRTMKAGEFVSREFQVLDKLQNCENVVRLLNIYYSNTEEGKCV